MEISILRNVLVEENAKLNERIRILELSEKLWQDSHHRMKSDLMSRIQELESAIRECYKRFEDYSMGCDDYAPRSHRDFMTKLSKVLRPDRNGCWTPDRENCDCPACGGFND